MPKLGYSGIAVLRAAGTECFVSSLCAWLIGSRFCCPSCVNVPSVSPCYRQKSIQLPPSMNLQICNFSQTNHDSVLGGEVQIRTKYSQVGTAKRMPAHASTCSVRGDSTLMLTVLSENVNFSCGQSTRSLQQR